MNVNLSLIAVLCCGVASWPPSGYGQAAGPLQQLQDRVRARVQGSPVLGPLLDPVQTVAPPGATINRPTLGFVAEEQDQDGERPAGVYVQEVNPGGAAQQAGFQVGDQIVQVGQQSVGRIEDLTDWILAQAAGQRADVVLRRGEQQIRTQVTLQSAAGPPAPGTMLPTDTRSLPAAPPAGTQDGQAGVPTHGRLGVVVEQDPTVVGQGRAMIVNLVPNSPAAIAGLQIGDAILAIDDSAIGGAAQLQQHMRATRAGQEVQVRYLREGQENTVRLTLMGPEPEAMAPRATLPPQIQAAGSDRVPSASPATDAPSPTIPPTAPQPRGADSEVLKLNEMLEKLQSRVDQLEQRLGELEAVGGE